jgi:sulfhydrogenase subunit beta (sulfur reductase)
MTVQISKNNILVGLKKAQVDYKIAALKQKGEKFLFDYINTPDEVIFEFKPTVLSPKKFFFPQEETILEYTADGKVSAKIEAEPLLLFGVRPCDVNAIKILDKAFSESHGDPNYLAKREKSIVIGFDCAKLCDQKAFCYRVKTQNATTGADLMLLYWGDKFFVTFVTKKGAAFAAKYLQTQEGDLKEVEEYKKKKEKEFNQVSPFRDLEKLPEIFEENKDHFIWKERASKCLSCGSCIMVCPTCYCFDVADELALNLKNGQRLRRWDACMLSSFAEVASGENFRPTAEQRLKHRLNRKFNYLMKKFGEPVCVGCGRCVRACLADINPKLIVKVLTGEQG